MDRPPPPNEGAAAARKATDIAGSVQIIAPPDKARMLEAEVAALRRQLQTQLSSDVHPVAYIELRTSGLITAANSSATPPSLAAIPMMW